MGGPKFKRKKKKPTQLDYERKTIAKQHWFQQLDLP
jgi:hypothetical protein